jgi:hypothetical protein
MIYRLPVCSPCYACQASSRSRNRASCKSLNGSDCLYRLNVYIRLTLNDWMCRERKRFSCGDSRLLRGPQQHLADEALGCLRDDHFDHVGYILWLQHLGGVFSHVR